MTARLDARRPPLVSEDELVSGLTTIGIHPGASVLVHASLSSFGTVIGGEQTVIGALRRTVGGAGTIVMPTQSWQLCDPDFLDDPALTVDDRARVRRTLPPFDAALTPTRSMGSIAELFRLQPHTMRSTHPHRSFAAAGPRAPALTAVHEPASPFGETSPLARLYDVDAVVLLLGVGFEKCTSFHLAEQRAAHRRNRRRVANGAAVLVDGVRSWIDWEEPTVDDRDFAAIGTAFEATGTVRATDIGTARCRAMSMVSLVDFAVRHMETDSRSETTCRAGKDLSEC